MKRIALFTAFVMLVLSISVSAASLDFKIDKKDISFYAVDCSLDLKGTIKGAKSNSYVLMEIYPAEKTNDIDYAVCAVSTVTSGDGFEFSDVLLPENMTSGSYSILLTSMYNTKSIVIEDAFYYGGKSKAKEIIRKIDLAQSVEEIDGIIKLNHKEIGFEYFDDYYKNITSYSTALTDVYNESFSDSEEKLTENWEKLLKLLKKGTMCASILDTTSKDVVKKIVENNQISEELGLILENKDGTFNAYEASSQETKEILYEMMLSSQYNLPSELPQIFKSMSAVSYLRNERYTDAIKVFDSVSDIKTVNYAYYNLLIPTVQDNLLKAVSEKAKTVLDIKDVISYFEEETQKAVPIYQGGVISGTTGGTGGTSGGGYVPSVKNEDTVLNEITFSDLKDVKWAEQAILTLAKKGIVNGVSQNIFAPDEYVTRAQLCKIASLSFNLDLKEESKISFADINEGEWYKQYVDILSSNKIVNGYESGEFKPNAYVTRQELSVIIDRILKLKGINKEKVREFKEFNDNSLISDYALESITNLYEYGILNGDGENVMPLSNATRAQTAQLVYLLIGD